MCGTAARAIMKAPPRFTVIILVQASGGMSQNDGLRLAMRLAELRLMPALLTRMCSPPSLSMVLRTARSASAGSLTSPTTSSTASSPPISRATVALRPSVSGLSSIMATRAPASTRASDMILPMPISLPAPVTIATLPSNGPVAMRPSMHLRRPHSGPKPASEAVGPCATGEGENQRYSPSSYSHSKSRSWYAWSGISVVRLRLASSPSNFSRIHLSSSGYSIWSDGLRTVSP